MNLSRPFMFRVFGRELVQIIFVGLVALGFAGCQPSKKADGGGPAVVDPNCGNQNSQATCTKNASCTWTGSLCSGTDEYCKKFSGDQSCPASSCQWSSSLLKCQKFATTIPTAGCSNHQQSDCSLVAGCQWNGTACVLTASNGGNPSTTTGVQPPVVPSPPVNPLPPVPPLPPPTSANQAFCQAQSVVWCWQFASKGCQYRALPLPPHCDI